MNMHQHLAEIYWTVRQDSAAEHSITRHMVRRVLDNMSEYTAGDQGAMWETARQTLENVLDVAAGNGTNETAFEVRHCLQHDSGTYSIDLTSSEDSALIQQLLGNLWQHNFSPDSDFTGPMPLDQIVAYWCSLLGDAAEQAVIEYTAELENSAELEEEEEE